MKASPCQICAGSRKIRLALRYSQSFMIEPGAIKSDAPAYKEFACPECAPTVPETNVAVLNFSAFVQAFDDPEYEKHVRTDAAHRLVDALVDDGFVQFIKGPVVGDYSKEYELTGRVGVVSTAVVASLEERIAERQTEVAQEVARRAAEEISLWGSAYSGNEGSISKSQAIDAINRATKAVFAKREKRRKAEASQ